MRIDGITALLMAVELGHSKIVALLLSHSDVEYTNKKELNQISPNLQMPTVLSQLVYENKGELVEKVLPLLEKDVVILYLDS